MTEMSPHIMNDCLMCARGVVTFVVNFTVAAHLFGNDLTGDRPGH